MQQTDSRNKVITFANMEMDTNLFEIDKVFLDAMQIMSL